MKPSKMNWRNSSRAKHLLESHSLFSQKSSEQEELDGIRFRFLTYHLRQGHVLEESSLKLKERDS
jgi:hypothetical protein